MDCSKFNLDWNERFIPIYVLLSKKWKKYQNLLRIDWVFNRNNFNYVDKEGFIIFKNYKLFNWKDFFSLNVMEIISLVNLVIIILLKKLNELTNCILLWLMVG